MNLSEIKVPTKITKEQFDQYSHSNDVGQSWAWGGFNLEKPYIVMNGKDLYVITPASFLNAEHYLIGSSFFPENELLKEVMSLQSDELMESAP